jgi:hypothetical protein
VRVEPAQINRSLVCFSVRWKPIARYQPAEAARNVERDAANFSIAEPDRVIHTAVVEVGSQNT